MDDWRVPLFGETTKSSFAHLTGWYHRYWPVPKVSICPYSPVMGCSSADAPFTAQPGYWTESGLIRFKRSSFIHGSVTISGWFPSIYYHTGQFLSWLYLAIRYPPILVTILMVVSLDIDSGSRHNNHILAEMLDIRQWPLSWVRKSSWISTSHPVLFDLLWWRVRMVTFTDLWVDDLYMWTIWDQTWSYIVFSLYI